jgi:hypothetical protein
MKFNHSIKIIFALSSTLAFAGLNEAQIQAASAELTECSVKLRGDKDLAVLRIPQEASGAPDWEVGALQNLLKTECKLSDKAVELLDREESSYLKTERFNATINPEQEGVAGPEKGSGVIKLYGDFGDFYIMPDIGDMFTVIHHRAD